ncbi:MAG: glycoside hydrolase N-terminal domain-containing protein [Candidatus Wallacebacter cryptica]
MSQNNKNKLVMRYPTSWWSNPWREALPSGNGKIGAAVYGGIHRETVLINHNQLWHGGKKDLLPDVSGTLHTVRSLMEQKRYHEANWVLADALKEHGYDTRMAKPLPLGNLLLNTEIRTGFTNYRRVLDMETGEVTVSWQEEDKQFNRKLFVSRADDLIVCRIQGSALNSTLTLTLHQQDSADKRRLEESMLQYADGHYLYYAAKHPDETDFGAVARIITKDGEIEAEQGRLIISGASEVLILVKVFVYEQHQDAWQRLSSELAAENRTYDELLAAHCELHTPLFNSVKLSLADSGDKTNEELLLDAYDGELAPELAEKMWAYGRYLFISSTDESSYPMHMYGLWVGSYRAVWSHFMANENIQMIYWHALSGGLAHLVPPMFAYYEGLMDDFRENARKLFGCRGIFIPAGTTPLTGLPSQVVPVILNWTGAAGWLSQHFYQYWLYTGDDDFLKNKVLPFMREAALFYEDFLVEGVDGYLQLYPSVSPENTPSNYVTPEARTLGHPMPSTINATMEFAIVKELLANLIEGSKYAGMYGEERGKWEELLSKIPPYQINEDGAVKEWMHPDFDDNYNHRHLSHLYPLFPGQEVTPEKDPDLYDAFVEALKQRLVVGISAQTGWSLAHMANLYARLGDGENALTCLELLSRSCLINNFYTLHNDWRNMGITLQMPSAPIQLDANLGWTSAVQEMLLYVSPELIRVLPACPTKWQRGRVEDFRFCTGQISFSWDRPNLSFTAEITAERETDVTIRLPDGFGEYKIACTDGTVERLENSSYWQLRLPAGAVVTIKA